MDYFYSKSTNGFYIESINGTDMPGDVVTISEEVYRGILDGAVDGVVWGSDENGYPVLIPVPEPTPAELITLANNKKSALLQSINSKTQMWQTQLALGMITDADKATLIVWMKYAQAVSAVDTSTVPDITWPTVSSIGGKV